MMLITSRLLNVLSYSQMHAAKPVMTGAENEVPFAAKQTTSGFT